MLNNFSLICKFDLQEGLECVAVFSFTSQVVNVMFENCFLHVLTQTGIETYNIPTLRSVIFKEKPVIFKFYLK